MRVFAEYFKHSDEVRFRRKTLLQFGNSTRLIGTAVLMNPGSAEPVNSANSENIDFIQRFFRENHNIEVNNSNEWYEFSSDATMRWIENIFSGYYLDKYKPLNGVIQLFNCSYYKDPLLENAKNQFEKYPEYFFDEAEFFKDKPVYFGWGEVGKDRELSEVAKQIFSNYDLSLTPIYDPIFENNRFTHPRVMQTWFGRNEYITNLATQFYNLVEPK